MSDSTLNTKKTVILVGGYRGMGKDYISQNGLRGYEIFFRPGTSQGKLRTLLSSLGRVSVPVPIFKFADPLRNLLGPFMGLSPDIIAQYDSIKDLKDRLPYNGSIRDYFIGIGAAVRNVDPDFFVKRLIVDIKQCESDTVIVSDWRYPNEFDYMKDQFNVVTVRVHRVMDNDDNLLPIPDKNIVSERSLDDTETDFLVTPRSQFKLLFTHVDHLFPQYTSYNLYTEWK